MLALKHEERMEYIKNHLRKHYTEDEITTEDFTTFNTKDAVVWIDPLDGTSDFIKGNFTAVTVLIGLSIKGFSRAGVVHNVYSTEEETLGMTYFGTGEHGAFKAPYHIEMDFDEVKKMACHCEYLKPFNLEEKVDDDYKIRVAASLSHFSSTMQEILETLAPVEIKRIGGAGNKCNSLAINEVDCYIHPSPGLCYWDLCAPEALIKGMGGYGTNLAKERLTYPLDGDRKLKGLILAHNPEMYKTIEKRMGEHLTNIMDKVKL
jgi:3'(2'), 5'-bisphosphate nucleotidase